jgi:hypothetical protein
MKSLRYLVVLFLFVTTPCFAGRREGGRDPGNNNNGDSSNANQIVVTGVTPGANGCGTIAITGNVIFAVTQTTTILIDGTAAALKDVHAGLGVLSQTTPDCSMPEIDLKTLASTPATTKTKKQKSSQNN